MRPEDRWAGLTVKGETLSGDELHALASVLTAGSHPRLDPAKTDRLVETIRLHMLGAAPFRDTLTAARAASPFSHLLRIVTPQAGLLRPVFWVTSLVVLAAAALFTVTGDQGPVVPLIAAAPLCAALGLVYSFRADAGMRELEQSCPLSLYETSLGRLLVVLSYDLLILMPAAAVIRLLGFVTSLPSFCLALAAPTALVALVALHLSLRNGPLAGMVGSTSCWVVLVVAGLQFPQYSLTGFTVLSGATALKLAVLLASGLGFAYTLRLARRLEAAGQA